MCFDFVFSCVVVLFLLSFVLFCIVFDSLDYFLCFYFVFFFLCFFKFYFCSCFDYFCVVFVFFLLFFFVCISFYFYFFCLFVSQELQGCLTPISNWAQNRCIPGSVRPLPLLLHRNGYTDPVVHRSQVRQEIGVVYLLGSPNKTFNINNINMIGALIEFSQVLHKMFIGV